MSTEAPRDSAPAEPPAKPLEARVRRPFKIPAEELPPDLPERSLLRYLSTLSEEDDELLQELAAIDRLRAHDDER